MIIITLYLYETLTLIDYDRQDIIIIYSDSNIN